MSATVTEKPVLGRIPAVTLRPGDVIRTEEGDSKVVSNERGEHLGQRIITTEDYTIPRGASVQIEILEVF